MSGDHVDVFTKVLASLDGDVKTGLANAAPELIRTAATSGLTPEEFAADLHAIAERIAPDGGMSRFERQRRATRLRTWTDRATGMWRLSGTFDPETGARIHGRLEAAMAAMFATKTPSTTPTDAGEKQDHLRALALLALTTGWAAPKTKSGEPGTNTAPTDHAKHADGSGRTDHSDSARHHDNTDQDNTDNTDNADQDNIGKCGNHDTTENTDNHGDDDDTASHDQSSADEWNAFAAPLGVGTNRFGRPELTVVIAPPTSIPTDAPPSTGASLSPSPGDESKTSAPMPTSDQSSSATALSSTPTAS